MYAASLFVFVLRHTVAVGTCLTPQQLQHQAGLCTLARGLVKSVTKADIDEWFWADFVG